MTSTSRRGLFGVVAGGLAALAGGAAVARDKSMAWATLKPLSPATAGYVRGLDAYAGGVHIAPDRRLVDLWVQFAQQNRDAGRQPIFFHSEFMSPQPASDADRVVSQQVFRVPQMVEADGRLVIEKIEYAFWAETAPGAQDAAHVYTYRLRLRDQPVNA